MSATVPLIELQFPTAQPLPLEMVAIARGMKGEPGRDGVDGVDGVNGVDGGQGTLGEVGPTGDPGPDGEKGPIGDPGPDGNKGPSGDKGPDGDRGQPGDVGQQGGAGDKGLIGDAGPRGPVGDPGARGPDGDAGATGDKGLPGDQGPKGLAGDKGPSGDKGLVGDKGPTGATGADGAAGGKGAAGDAGPVGGKGPVGDKGPQGDVGPAGGTDPLVVVFAGGPGIEAAEITQAVLQMNSPGTPISMGRQSIVYNRSTADVLFPGHQVGHFAMAENEAPGTTNAWQIGSEATVTNKAGTITDSMSHLATVNGFLAGTDNPQWTGYTSEPTQNHGRIRIANGVRPRLPAGHDGQIDDWRGVYIPDLSAVPGVGKRTAFLNEDPGAPFLSASPFCDSSWAAFGISSGGSTVIPNQVSLVFLNGNGLTDSAYIEMPSDPPSGLRIDIYCSSGISSVGVVCPTHAVYGAPSSVPPNGCFTMRYVAAIDAWICVGNPDGTTGPKGDKGDPSPETQWLEDAAASRTLSLADIGAGISMTSASANQVLVPLFADVPFPANTSIPIEAGGAGKTTIVGAAGVSILFDQRLTNALAARYSSAVLVNRGANNWRLVGALAPASP